MTYIYFYNVLQQIPSVCSSSHITIKWKRTSRFHRLFVMTYLVTLLVLILQSTQSR